MQRDRQIESLCDAEAEKSETNTFLCITSYPLLSNSLSHHHCYGEPSMGKDQQKLSSGGGSVGRAVASDT